MQRDTENGDVFDELVIATRSTGRGPNGQVSMPDQGVTVATSIKFARISKILDKGSHEVLYKTWCQVLQLVENIRPDTGEKHNE